MNDMNTRRINLVFFPVLLALNGCTMVSDKDVEKRYNLLTEEADVDGDGLDSIGHGGTDCDDNDPDITLGETWYADTDGDGYGDADAGVVACDAPDEHIADSTDCDDTAPTINPDGTEVCGDGLDNDCDGAVDDATAVDASTWYADTDGGGYGDVDAGVVACDAPDEHIADSTDCDDTAPTINPDGLELIGDDRDSDCDGDTDNMLFVEKAAVGVTDGPVITLTGSAEGQRLQLAWAGNVCEDEVTCVFVEERVGDELSDGEGEFFTFPDQVAPDYLEKPGFDFVASGLHWAWVRASRFNVHAPHFFDVTGYSTTFGISNNLRFYSSSEAEVSWDTLALSLDDGNVVATACSNTESFGISPRFHYVSVDQAELSHGILVYDYYSTHIPADVCRYDPIDNRIHIYRDDYYGLYTYDSSTSTFGLYSSQSDYFVTDYQSKSHYGHDHWVRANDDPEFSLGLTSVSLNEWFSFDYTVVKADFSNTQDDRVVICTVGASGETLLTIRDPGVLAAVAEIDLSEWVDDADDCAVGINEAGQAWVVFRDGDDLIETVIDLAE